MNRGLPIVSISHNMPHVFETADRIHKGRIDRRLRVIRPHDHSMPDDAAVMTETPEPPVEAVAAQRILLLG